MTLSAQPFMWGTIPPSLASLQLHYRDLDVLIPEALHAVSADGRLDADQDAKLQNSCNR